MIFLWAFNRERSELESISWHEFTQEILKYNLKSLRLALLVLNLASLVLNLASLALNLASLELNLDP